MPNLLEKNIFLLSAEKNFPKNPGKQEIYWVFFGRDYERLLELKKTTPAGYRYIDIGNYLEKSANDLRRQYLDFIGSLSQRFSSLWWWSSRISEKNVMASPLFLYVCYLDILSKVINNIGKNESLKLCVFSESPALLDVVSCNYLAKNFKIASAIKRRRVVRFFAVFVRVLSFCWRGIRRKFWTAVAQKGRVEFKEPITILRTWIGDKNLGDRKSVV